MTLNRNEIYQLVGQLKEKLVGSQLESIKEIIPFKWILSFKKTTEFLRLLFCLKAPFIRFHLLSMPCKTYENSRTQTWMSFLNYAVLDAVEMIGNDRIIRLVFRKDLHFYTVVFELFPQRPNLYLLDDHSKILQVINSTTFTIYNPPLNIKENELLKFDTSITHQTIEKAFEEKENEWAFQSMKDKIHSEIQHRIKRNAKLQKKAGEDLERCRRWKEIQHEAVLLQTQLYRLKKGMNEIGVSDWEKEGKEVTITLDIRKSPQEEIVNRFKISKKLKNGLIHHQKVIDRLQEEASQLNLCFSELDKLMTLTALDKLAVKIGLKREVLVAKKKAAPSLPYHEFKSASGLSIWVGKNALANDKLTFSFAKGLDWWLHVDHYPGSHVIIRNKKNMPLDDETLQDALQLAMAYSKAKNKGEAEVCLTQCKYVSRLGKNQPGKVQISQHKKILIKYDPDRFQRIKSRPDAFV